MALSQMGSLNALEQCKGNSFWRRWLGSHVPSADTVGRVFAKLDCDRVRAILRHTYTRLKRNKALRPAFGEVFALIIDGHESNSSYLRSCPGCLKRTVETKEGERIQYYHRNVTAMLLAKDFPVLLDFESQQPGEDEVATAMRLTRRVLENYPRAFSLVLGDGLYARAPFFRLVLDHGKHVIAVLNDERREVVKDAEGLFRAEEPLVSQHGSTQRQCWDIEEFNSWPQVGQDVRVVRSLETTTLRRQMDDRQEEHTTDWIWATTPSKKEMSTEPVVDLGHARWEIENKELNELVTWWYADHLYKHHPVAITAFWLLVMLAYNLFHAFIHLNLKPEIRFSRTKRHWACTVTAEIYYWDASHLLPVPT